MYQLLLRDQEFRSCTVKGIYEFRDPKQFLDILNSYQKAVPKERQFSYPDGRPKRVMISRPNVWPCDDGILLRGMVQIGEHIDHFATIGAIIYRPDIHLTPSGLYLVRLVPQLRNKKDRIKQIQPQLPDVLAQYLMKTQSSPKSK